MAVATETRRSQVRGALRVWRWGLLGDHPEWPAVVVNSAGDFFLAGGSDEPGHAHWFYPISEATAKGLVEDLRLTELGKVAP